MKKNENISENQQNEIKGKEIEDDKSNISTRRKLLGLALFGGAAVLGSLKEKVARADPSDAAAINRLTFWMQTTYATQIGPTLDSLKKNYELAKGWVDDWNNFVHAYNQAAQYVQDGIKALTDPQENIFYLQAKQMIDYVDRILDYKGNILSFRLQYLNPVIMQKIDSYIYQVQGFSYRTRNLAMLKYFEKKSEDEISSQQKKDFLEKYYKGSNLEKITIRASNDVANYGFEALRIQGFKDTFEFLKTQVANIPNIPGKPQKGTAPQKSRGQVFQEIAAVPTFDIQVQQLNLLNEISMKLTNLILVTSQAGQGPFVSESEQMVTQNMFERVADQMQTSVKDNENAFYKTEEKPKKRRA